MPPTFVANVTRGAPGECVEKSVIAGNATTYQASCDATGRYETGVITTAPVTTLPRSTGAPHDEAVALMHAPPQRSWPVGQTAVQADATQAVPAAQTTPQPPQFDGSTRVSRQTPPQAESGLAHDAAHVPALHI